MVISLLCVLMLGVSSAPKGVAPEVSLSIDGEPVALMNARLQSATTTAGRPTFVVMADLGEEHVFMRATLPEPEPGVYTLRSMRLRAESEPRAWLNIDSRPESGLPLLRADGGTLEVRAIAVDDAELIQAIEITFSGEMGTTAGTRHGVTLSIRWQAAPPAGR